MPRSLFRISFAFFKRPCSSLIVEYRVIESLPETLLAGRQISGVLVFRPALPPVAPMLPRRADPDRPPKDHSIRRTAQA